MHIITIHIAREKFLTNRPLHFKSCGKRRRYNKFSRTFRAFNKLKLTMPVNTKNVRPLAVKKHRLKSLFVDAFYAVSLFKTEYKRQQGIQDAHQTAYGKRHPYNVIEFEV